MLAGDPVMSHSLLSVPLNLGLLAPMEVIRAAEARYRDGTARLSSVEGFIRQVLGWREYVRGLYWHLGPAYLRRNALGARRRLPEWWWHLDADQVGARCLHTALAAVRDHGWTHHIQRLMILGNHALQRGYDPAELTDGFAGVFTDCTPWVMPANVIGMSQYADGGLVTTKPYAAGGGYINRMSDYCRGCPYDPKRRLGEDLGGIIPAGEELSDHLASRAEVGRILLGSGVPTVVLNAAVIIGSGSASFEMLQYLTERLPAMVTPQWVHNRIQPIALRDVLHY
jgi:deoxyribodipyrimidine photolyase-related protein